MPHSFCYHIANAFGYIGGGLKKNSGTRSGSLALICSLSFACTTQALLGAESVSAASPAQVSGANLDERMQGAKALLDQRNAEQAYHLLSEVEFEGAGNEAFDYLLGTAALDAGKPDKATLAFDRVLALNPKHGGALIDRGRAYAAIGNIEQARADFESALALNPSAPTRKQLATFLAQLSNRQEKLGATVRAYMSATIGHDSNVNFAASERDVFVPLLQDSIQLSSDSARQSDTFLGLNAGIGLDYTVAPAFAWFGAIDAASKRNRDVHQFHLSSLDARFGPVWKGQRYQMRWALSLGALQLGDEDYRRQRGAGVEWRFNISDQRQLVTAVQHTRLRYRDVDAKIFNTNQSVGLLGLSLLIGEGKQALVTPYLMGGYEDDTGGNLQGNKRIAGAGLTGRLALTPTRSLSWAVSGQRGRFDKTDPFFLKKRSDQRFDVSLAFNQQLGQGKKWSLRPQVTWSRQNSNLAPYDFDRTEAGVTVRREF